MRGGLWTCLMLSEWLLNKWKSKRVWSYYILFMLCASQTIVSHLAHLWPLYAFSLSVCLHVCLFVCLFILSVCLSLWLSFVIPQVKSLRTQRCSDSTRCRWMGSRISTNVWRQRWSRERSSPCTRQRTLPGPDKRSVSKLHDYAPLHKRSSAKW